MAYDTNSLNVRSARLGAGIGGANAGLSAALFCYVSADDNTTVIASGYVDDGGDKGLQVNDVVEIVDTATPLVTHAVVTVVAANGDVTMVGA